MQHKIKKKKQFNTEYRCILSYRNKKSGAVLLCFDIFYSLTSWHCHLFALYHYVWQSFEKGSSYSQTQTLAMKTVNDTTVIFNTIQDLKIL